MILGNISLVSMNANNTEINLIESSIYISLCAFGIITNSLNIYVFYQLGLENRTFKYILMVSIADLTYLVIFVVQCVLVLRNSTYIEKLFEIIFVNYLTSALAIFVVLIELVNSFERYLILKNNSYFKTISSNLLILICVIISLILYFPLSVSNDIQTKSITLSNDANFVHYKLELNNFGTSKAYDIIVKLIWSIRIFLSAFLLTLINIISAVELKKRLNKRGKLQLNLTHMSTGKLFIFFLI